MRHGGKILVDSLKAQGISRVFCVPGESFLPVLDGLYESGIDVVVCRQEGGASMMAEAHGKLTGAPGVVFVTRGPGATNASSGVHVAQQDSTPMILFIGQIARGFRDREAFQEVDFRAMFGPLAKWAAEVEETARIPEYISRAFHTAMSGRRGPVVLSLVEDMLFAEGEAEDALPAVTVEARASADDAQAIWTRLAASERPMVIVGGGGWSSEAAQNLQAVAESSGLPVVASFRRQDYLDNLHPNYVGDLGLGAAPGLLERIRTADLVLLLGARLGEMPSASYGLLDVPNPRQVLIHTHPGAEELGRVYRPALAINATSPSIIARLRETLPAGGPRWQAWTTAARAIYEAHGKPQPTIGAVRLEEVVTALRDILPPDAIVTNGAGNYSGWLHRYHRFRQYGTQLAPTAGSMGYGLPAAIAAKLARPEVPVVCFAGDGCLQMTIQELGTAAQHRANIVVVVCNNGIYGTIRLHQEREYPGRVSGTTLRNPDFVALAESYGFHAQRVEATDAFPDALRAALAAGRPALIELRTDPRALSHRFVMADR